MDDIWNIEAWDVVKLFFPDNRNGSRIIIKTRVSNLAYQLSGSDVLEMNFLEDKSWNLLCEKVFGIHSCPLELEEIGKQINKNCKGLPLSIVVIGGILAKSQKTLEYWEYIAENLNSIVNLEDDERCLKILNMSYKHLPVHLKPCFLYMGVFPEDAKVRVSSLIKMWAAEGFLKPVHGKNSEMVAEEYLKDLINRNLVLVDKLGSTGKIRICNIHDLLTELCLREAWKQRFLNIVNLDYNISPDTITHRRIYIRPTINSRTRITMHSRAPLARSLICDHLTVLPPSFDFRLLRVLAVRRSTIFRNLDYIRSLLQLVNSRCLIIRFDFVDIPKCYFSSVHLLWNLQTLVVEGGVVTSFDIWKMPQLRHVKLYIHHLPDPPGDSVIMANLQMLSKVYNFRCGEEVVKRIPNIKKLRISYGDFDLEERLLYRLDNLCRLRKLESLYCAFSVMYQKSLSEKLQNLSFPLSLKKLALDGSRLNWDDMATKIGLLPNLQVLKLTFQSFVGPKWETVEGQFCKLKLLLISFCTHLEYWTTTDNTHFPCLEHVVLRGLSKLKEIPSAIGDIPTLRSVEMEDCSDSAIISAKEIVEKQEVLGNEGLLVRVRLWKKNKKLESLASHNFIVE